MATLVWFRDDLRLLDHAALHEAAKDPQGVICLYILDEVSDGVRPLGGATKWWLHHSLTSLRDSLAALGVPLTLRRGSAETIVPEVVASAHATRVLWNRRYGRAERTIDAGIKQRLRNGGTGTGTGTGIEAHSFAGNLLFEPWTIATKDGTPYRVYTPFWRTCLAMPAPPEPLAAPETLTAAPHQPKSENLEDWALLPTKPDWAGGLAAKWNPGEQSALDALDLFLDERANDYARARDMPATAATSELAAPLRFGEISARTVWHRSLAAAAHSGADVGTFLSEIGWREFAWHTLYHRPEMPERNLNRRYDAFAWATPDDETLEAWQRGRTGIPLVDAGMRELWHTGTMHNRVRMVVASLLTKNLLVDWRVGEAWFWDTLVDADQASNPFNWQWVAGSGLDAAPYFRIFNPVTQQKRFDAEGTYVDRWAPDSLLTPPLIDLKESRVRALAAHDDMQSLAAHTEMQAASDAN